MSFQVETLTTGQNNDLVARLWTQGLPTRGVVIIVHGLGDHSDRFSALAKELTREGWGVMAFDLPGHGLSGHGLSGHGLSGHGSSGHRWSGDGPTGRERRSTGSFRTLLAEIASARQLVARRLPGQRHILLGHSMGGNLALNYVLRHQEWSAVID